MAVELRAEKGRYEALIAGSLSTEEMLLDLEDIRLRLDYLQAKRQAGHDILLLKVEHATQLLSQSSKVRLPIPGLLSSPACSGIGSVQTKCKQQISQRTA